jgi:myo-inositol 2-dehydrogenase/D-chiro-inositol 1-dehydrogenase
LQEVIKEAEAYASVKVMVGFTRRFDDQYLEALSRIKRGAIGDPIVIRSQACDTLNITAMYKSYLQVSGGIFLDATIHDIDLALFFFGEDAQPKSAWAAGITAHHKELQETGDADNAVGICEFHGGKLAYFYNSRTTAFGFDNQTEIFGMSGEISINLSSRRNKLEQHDSNGITIEPNTGWAERYSEAFVCEINSFTEAILENKPIPVPLKSAWKSLRIAEALQQSLRTGKRVELNLKE